LLIRTSTTSKVGAVIALTTFSCLPNNVKTPKVC